ncbi:MAG: MGMT family protein [bacterium]
MSTELFNKIYEIILKIPKGKVATYGQIAAMAGQPHAARTIGWALNSLPNGSGVPWHRVINAQGKSSFPDESRRKLQQALLEAEGIKFEKEDQVDLDVFQWHGK